MLFNKRSRRRKKRSIPSTDPQRMRKNLEFLNWAQEYSKKIVSITFLIFVLSNIFFLGLITAEFIRNADLTYIDIYMQEVHLTFREVIGGYLIKAATENVIKIGGSYLESYMTTKANIVKEKMMSDAGLNTTDYQETYVEEEEYYDGN